MEKRMKGKQVGVWQNKGYCAKTQQQICKNNHNGNKPEIAQKQKVLQQSADLFFFFWDFPSGGDSTGQKEKEGFKGEIQQLCRSRSTPRNELKRAISDSGWAGWVGGEENVIMGEFSVRPPVKTEVVEAVAPIWEAILGSDIVAPGPRVYQALNPPTVYWAHPI